MFIFKYTHYIICDRMSINTKHIDYLNTILDGLLDFPDELGDLILQYYDKNLFFQHHIILCKKLQKTKKNNIKYLIRGIDKIANIQDLVNIKSTILPQLRQFNIMYDKFKYDETKQCYDHAKYKYIHAYDTRTYTWMYFENTKQVLDDITSNVSSNIICYGPWNPQKTNNVFHQSLVTSIDMVGLTELQEIGDKWLSKCKYLQSVDFSGMCKLKIIGNNCMMKCRSLKSMSFNNLYNLKTIGEGLLKQCATLQIINFNNLNSIQFLNRRLIFDCKSLETVNFNGFPNLMGISNSVFSYCTKIKNINFTNVNNIKFIGKRLISYSNIKHKVIITGLSKFIEPGYYINHTRCCGKCLITNEYSKHYADVIGRKLKTSIDS